MRRLSLVLVQCLLALLSGCASTHTPPAAPEPSLFADEAFSPPSEPVGGAGLFTLSPAMRAYLKSPAFTTHLRDSGLEHGLLNALYSKNDLQLEYDSSRTRTAAETYAARSGNCLSLVIMTAAFARELGMTVRYQSVDVEETWSRNSGLYLVASHVNIVLGHRPRAAYDESASRELVVDFVPSKDAANFHARQLEEDDIVSLFMNNRAVETMIQGHLNDAYWWARAAIEARPSNVAAYNTLAVIYQRHGKLDLAERAYRVALQHEPENIVVMQNLAPILAQMGRTAEAQELAQRAAKIQPTPPFHYFDQGMVALRDGNYGAARDMFEREVRRAPDYDEFHFWLAVTLLRMGEAREAREQLALAVDTSTRADNKQLYSAKLTHLRQLAASTGSRIR
jgi:Tfp pilus assembly protein PilF